MDASCCRGRPACKLRPNNGSPQGRPPQGVLFLGLGPEFAYFEAAFPTLEGLWLPTSAGDEQVVLLTAQALQDIA